MLPLLEVSGEHLGPGLGRGEVHSSEMAVDQYVVQTVKLLSCFRAASGRDLAHIYRRVWQGIFFWIGCRPVSGSECCVAAKRLALCSKLCVVFGLIATSVEYAVGK